MKQYSVAFSGPKMLTWKIEFKWLEMFHSGDLIVSVTRDVWDFGEKRKRDYDLFRLPSKFLKLTGRIFISANGIECSWPFQWNQLMPLL